MDKSEYDLIVGIQERIDHVDQLQDEIRELLDQLTKKYLHKNMAILPRMPFKRTIMNRLNESEKNSMHSDTTLNSTIDALLGKVDANLLKDISVSYTDATNPFYKIYGKIVGIDELTSSQYPKKHRKHKKHYQKKGGK